MGQTLSNGVYLPNEGERNCYAGLASNWQILNTAVGNIAEKAPLVHTHGNITNDGKVGTTANLPLITGTGGAITAGAFGNQANTFCEGNDSRLSDARTPVAHTHTKSDVTDLFNSANTWSKNNTYSADCIVYNSDSSGSIAGLKLRNSKAEVLSTGNTSSDQSMTFRDKNDVAISYIKGAVQSNGVALKIGAYAKDSSNNTVTTELQLLAFSNGNKAIFPSTTGTYDLGTSNYKWKTLNGINPGALSLPGAYQGINDQIKNPSDQLNAIDLNGGNNTWVSDVDCYLYFYIPNNKFTWIRIFWPATLIRCGQTFVPVPNESFDYSGFVPVPANTTVVIRIKGTQAPIFRRSACLGNV